jgi:hypothetical protein
MTLQMMVCDNASPALCDTSNLEITVLPSVYAHITEAQVEQVSCFGLNNGSIAILQVDVAEGANYTWNTGSTSANQSNLAPGTYTVEVTALADCAIPTMSEFTIVEPEALVAQINALPIVDAAGGSIECLVSGGTPPYTYAWTGPAGYTSTSATASGIMQAGQYTLTITDANDCALEEQAIMTTTDEVNPSFDCRIYPNPTDGDCIYVAFDAPGACGYSLHILDAAGRVLSSHSQLSSTNRIPIDQLASGVYCIRLETGEKTITRQFVRIP